MRCVICDFCEETSEVPTNNKVVLVDTVPICLACQEAILEANAEFEHEYLNSGEVEPPLPEVPEQ